MKEKASEWVSISDLMAGVMAVVMLLLVMSVLQKTYADLKHQQELAQGGAAQQQRIASMLTDLQQSVAAQGAEGLMSFNINEGKITLKDSIFEKGSACITPLAASVFKSIDLKIANFLQANPKAVIFVEGHTDSAPVGAPVTDYRRFCAVYDDNFILSAARARETRNLIIGSLDQTQVKRVAVAGYGDSKLIEGIDPNDARQRRVEIQFSAVTENK